MTEEEFIRDNPQHSHLKDDDLWDDMTEAMLASDMEFEELLKQEGPTESYSVVIWDPKANPQIVEMLELQEHYKNEAFKSVGIPSKYLGSCDPYKEDNSLTNVTIFEEIGGFWQRIIDKIIKK